MKKMLFSAIAVIAMAGTMSAANAEENTKAVNAEKAVKEFCLVEDSYFGTCGGWAEIVNSRGEKEIIVAVWTDVAGPVDCTDIFGKWVKSLAATTPVLSFQSGYSE